MAHGPVENILKGTLVKCRLCEPRPAYFQTLFSSDMLCFTCRSAGISLHLCKCPGSARAGKPELHYFFPRCGAWHRLPE